ncbi:MAG: 4Fe-4S binding protein [Lachnospiraceae bacterium]|nr:4Fe-4S binding protein [Lachnospiraceae bacterium]
MSHKIDDLECIYCGSCLKVCPVEAIYEGVPYVIDETSCIDCGACEDVCPVGAPYKVIY